MIRLLPRIPQEIPKPLLDGGIPPQLAMVLWSRGVRTAEEADAFLHPRLALHDPFLLPGMDAAVSRVREAIARREPIIVYGDYDVDGVCATALLVESLTQNGANASYYIPSRHREGYGLNREAALLLCDKAKLIITVDCGVTNTEEAALIQKNGVDLIITDHHEPPGALPEAIAVIDPLLGAYPFQKLCGAGVAFKLAQALFGFDAVAEQLDLVALATVADLVPLLDENRIFTHFGLQKIQQTKRVGLKALIQASELSGKVITSGHLAFQIGPRINAGGRLSEASRNVELLLTRDAEKAARIASELSKENTERKRLEDEILRQAITEVESTVDFLREKVLIIKGLGWNAGVIGLVASRLTERFAWPAVVLSESGGICVGSARSIPGINIHAALLKCEDLFIRFGGHAQAAGLTLAIGNMDAFRTRLNQAVAEVAEKDAYVPSAVYDLTCSLSDINISLIHQMEKLSPTGFGNPSPVFHSRGVQILEARNVGVDGKHLRLRLMQDGAALDGIAFGQGEMRADLSDQTDLLFSPAINEYMGKRSAQCNVSLLLPHHPLQLFFEKCNEKTECFERYLVKLVTKKTMPQNLQTQKALAAQALEASCQGALLVTRTLKGTLHIIQWLREKGLDNRLSFSFFAPRDIRKYNMLCALPDDGAEDGYREVFALDESFIPQAVAAIVPDDAELRSLYRTVRDGSGRFRSEAAIAEATGQRIAKVMLGLSVLGELELIAYQACPFQAAILPPHKCNPLDSELLRRARGVNGQEVTA